MRSMTGFGIGQAALGSGRLLLELRALNHRFVDVRVRVPAELFEQSSFIEQLARERLSRGRFDISVRLEGQALPPLQLDFTRVRAVYRALLELRDELAPGTDVPLGAVLAVPELTSAASARDSEPIREALLQALEHAESRLRAMRAVEGEALAREIATRIRAARALQAQIFERTSARVDATRARLKERLERLLADSSARLDPNRLEMEVAILADRSDVTEELVRLGSHFDQIERLLTSEEPVGRKLDFLLQEVGREANTIGSKSQDASLSHLVVELKAEIERIREQVQNVE